MDEKHVKMTKTFLMLVLMLTVWAYYPGLSGGFIFDDYTNIYKNHLLKIEHFSFEDLWQASLSINSGPLKRPVAMFSFAVNHVLTGMDPWWMKLTNLLIHLINGLLVLLVVRQLLHRFYDRNRTDLTLIPYFVMGIWLVHPINVTAVSYIVQRMTSLSATFVLLAVYCYLKLREGKFLDWRGHIFSFAILFFWVLGLLSKETAILLSIYIFVIEWCMYGFKAESKGEKKYLRILWALLAAPWICAFIYVLYGPSFILGGHQYWNFTHMERVLTESRIVIDYLRLIIIPDIRDMGLSHDDIVRSSSVFIPISTLLSMFLIAGILTSAIYAKQKCPLYSLGVFWFFGGHLLESTIIPLELMYLHRNYLPSLGIFLVFIEAGLYLYKNYRILTVIAALIVLLSFSICTRFLAYQWSDDYSMMIVEAMHNPKSIRANFKAGQTLKYYAIVTPPGKQKDEFKTSAIEYFKTIQKLNDQNVLGELSILETYIQLQEVPPQSFIKELINDLYSAEINIGIINLLGSITECMITKECHLKTVDYQRVLEALHNNPKMIGAFREKLLIIHAEYLAKARGNIDAAIAKIVEAINVHPTHDGLMLLALYLEEGGYEQEVKRTIDVLEEQDKLGRYRKFIRETRERLK